MMIIIMGWWGNVEKSGMDFVGREIGETFVEKLSKAIINVIREEYLARESAQGNNLPTWTFSVWLLMWKSTRVWQTRFF